MRRHRWAPTAPSRADSRSRRPIVAGQKTRPSLGVSPQPTTSGARSARSALHPSVPKHQPRAHRFVRERNAHAGDTSSRARGTCGIASRRRARSALRLSLFPQITHARPPAHASHHPQDRRQGLSRKHARPTGLYNETTAPGCPDPATLPGQHVDRSHVPPHPSWRGL